MATQWRGARVAYECAAHRSSVTTMPYGTRAMLIDPSVWCSQREGQRAVCVTVPILTMSHDEAVGDHSTSACAFAVPSKFVRKRVRRTDLTTTSIGTAY